jgi:intraflagellar transport protein 172
LDINEIIEDPDNNNIPEDDEFAITDIPSPYNVNMPMKNMISEGEKEKIKDWLLEVSMNQKFDSSLPLRSCEKCNTKIYEASATCYKCKNKSEICVLTGYPVNGSNGKQCKSCGKWGLKEHWSTYLNCFANCPWCNKLP